MTSTGKIQKLPCPDEPVRLSGTGNERGHFCDDPADRLSRDVGLGIDGTDSPGVVAGVE